MYTISHPEGGSLVAKNKNDGTSSLSAPIVRQLDPGAPKGSFSTNMSSTFQVIHAKNALKKSIESGSKGALNYHFDIKKINKSLFEV